MNMELYIFLAVEQRNVIGGGELYMMRMETKAVRVPGVADGFFCFVPDQEHEGILPSLLLS